MVGNDHRVIERTFDTVVDGRLVPLVDDANRHQHHPGAHVERPGQQEVHVCLLQFELALLFQPLDDRMFELELADEPDTVRKGVRHEQDETMEVESSVAELRVVEVKVHVAGKRRARLFGCSCGGLSEGRGAQQNEKQRMNGLHEHFGRGPRPNRQPSAVAAAHAHAVCRWIAFLDRDRLSGFQVVMFDEAEKVLVLIDHARDGERRVHRTREQRLRLLRLDQPFGVGNRIAVGIGLGPAEHGVHAIDETVADRVLELLRLVVDFVPRVTHHLDQEELDQTVAAGHECGKLLTGLGECHSCVRLVFDEPGIRQRLHHRRRGAGGHVERGCELTHGQKTMGRFQAVGPDIDGLEVVLDGARRHLTGV